jgi:hypothetical protein
MTSIWKRLQTDCRKFFPIQSVSSISQSPKDQRIGGELTRSSAGLAFQITGAKARPTHQPLLVGSQTHPPKKLTTFPSLRRSHHHLPRRLAQARSTARMLARLARGHLPVRAPAAMKPATSLLLGAALATAFFLLYTSLCHDLNGQSLATPPPRSSRGGEYVVVRSAAAGREVRTKEHEEVARREGERTKEVASSDGGAEERANRGS